jgi:hypothetical protein
MCGVIVDLGLAAMAWCVHPLAGLIVAAVAIYGRIRYAGE